MAAYSLVRKTPIFSAPGFKRIKVLTDFENKILDGRKLKLDYSEKKEIISDELFNDLKDFENFRTSHKYMVVEVLERTTNEACGNDTRRDKVYHVMTLFGGGIVNNEKILRFGDSAQKTDACHTESLESILNNGKIDRKGGYFKFTLE